VLVYLAKDPYWQSKAREEIKAAALKYSNDKDTSLIEQLQQLSMEAWESEFPVLDMCMRDSIRLRYVDSLIIMSTL